MVEAAESAGAPVRRGQDDVTVETVAGVTTTLGGLAIDDAARAADGVFACGADAGGIATGGYASGLAAALVFGRVAARAALGQAP
jgi:succinate dehydrogenase/fumarate reductase flavoprotein subunit